VSSGRIGRSVFSLGAGQLVARAVAFAGTAYLSRTLGPAGFGTLGFATALVGYVGLAVTLGFNEIGAREIAGRPSEARSIGRSVIALRLLMALGAYGILFVSVILWGPEPELRAVVLLTGLIFFPLSMDTSWVFKGLERNRPVGASVVVSQATFVALLFLFVSGPADLTRVPVAQVGGELLAAIALVLVATKSLDRSPSLGLRAGWKILRQSGHLALSRVLRTLIFTFDVLLLWFLVDSESVGYYVADYRLCFLLIVISDVVRESYLPRLVRSAGEGVESLAHWASRSMETTVAIGAPLVVGGILLAGPILELLFGAEYGAGGPALEVLLVSIGAIFLNTTVHNVLLAQHRLRPEMFLIGIATAANIGLNLILIPRFGIVGAAWATATSEVVILLGGLWLLYRVGVRIRFVPTVRSLLAASVMALAVTQLREILPVVFLVIAGGAVYVLSLAMLRGIPNDLRGGA
jgi:O-antigen/teichoic acid export membrane protein